MANVLILDRYFSASLALATARGTLDFYNPYPFLVGMMQGAINGGTANVAWVQFLIDDETDRLEAQVSELLDK